jgi:hypothetical protein
VNWAAVALAAAAALRANTAAAMTASFFRLRMLRLLEKWDGRQ